MIDLPTSPPQALDPAALRRCTVALLAGNFAIGSGVMVVPGALNDLATDLQVSVPVAGQLITVGAVLMAVGAPLLAAMVSGHDRRRLLALTLGLFGLGHVLCCLTTSYSVLLVLRAVTVLGAALFTPQAAAAMGHLAAPAVRGRAITTVFLGWSLASVLGTPLFTLVAETAGWRWSFALVAALSMASGAWVLRALPAGVRPPALSGRHWLDALTSPVALAIVGVTALASTGQFTMTAYLAPYFRHELDAGPSQLSLLYLWFGLFSVLGNVGLTRAIDRVGAARSVTIALILIGVGLSLFALAHDVAWVGLGLLVWGLGGFSSNSAQQARLGLLAPTLAAALISMNTTAIYIGQGLGAAGGGLLLSHAGYRALVWFGVASVLAALGLSLWAERTGRRRLARSGSAL